MATIIHARYDGKNDEQINVVEGVWVLVYTIPKTVYYKELDVYEKWIYNGIKVKEGFL